MALAVVAMDSSVGLAVNVEDRHLALDLRRDLLLLKCFGVDARQVIKSRDEDERDR